MKTILRVLLIVLIVGSLGWTVYFLYAKEQKPPEIFKTIAPVTTSIIQKTVATGAVIPRREVNMKSQVSGIVEKIYVEAGQEIKQGEVIAKVKIIPNMINLNNAENRLNQAKIAYDNAKAEFEVRLKSAKEETEAAENNLQLIKEGTTANAGQATNTLIRSTITGMILDVPVKEGNSVIESNTFNEGTTIASVADMGEMIFEGKVDESEVGKIRQGMELLLTIGALETEKFTARLEYISPKGMTENGAIQFKIRAAISMAKGQFLRAGYSANADIILARRDSVMTLPESVLQFKNDTTYVEVEVAPQQFSKKAIQTGLSDGINIEVTEGIQANEKVKTQQIVTTVGG